VLAGRDRKDREHGHEDRGHAAENAPHARSISCAHAAMRHRGAGASSDGAGAAPPEGRSWPA
jgi:hypothetical protein